MAKTVAATKPAACLAAHWVVAKVVPEEAQTVVQRGLEGKLVVAKVARGAVPLVALKVALTVEGWVALPGALTAEERMVATPVAMLGVLTEVAMPVAVQAESMAMAAVAAQGGLQAEAQPVVPWAAREVGRMAGC